LSFKNDDNYVHSGSKHIFLQFWSYVVCLIITTKIDKEKLMHFIHDKGKDT